MSEIEELESRLVKEIESYFGEDKKRINHAKEVWQYSFLIADRIREGNFCNRKVLCCGSLLHDIGIPVVERKYGSAPARYHEAEGAHLAKKFLAEKDLTAKEVEHVCKIIGHHHNPKTTSTLEFKVVYDADCIVNMSEEESQESGLLSVPGKVVATRFANLGRV